MKKVTGVLDIIIDVGCPYCKHMQDLILTNNYMYILDEVLSNSPYGIKSGWNYKVECVNCKSEFIVDSVKWFDEFMRG